MVFAVLGGVPRDKGWGDVVAEANRAIEGARRRIRVGPKDARHRRGCFPAIAAGVSHGGGQKKPSVLTHCTQNERALTRLFQNQAMRRLSGFANCKPPSPAGP
jgi:hypothetical protein